MTKNKFPLCPQLLPPAPSTPPRARELLLFITYGGGWGSEDLRVSRGFQGGREGGAG